MADTTEASNGGTPAPAAMVASTESEREAASVAQVEAPSAAEPCVKVRRETEPVTTSLSTEEHSRASDNAQVIRSVLLHARHCFCGNVVCIIVSSVEDRLVTEVHGCEQLA